MLTPELMGGLALAIMWTATLLISAVALGDLVRLIRRRARLAPLTVLSDGATGSLSGTVASGGTLATLVIEEVGRTRAARRSILFHPRALRCAIEGGILRLDDGTEVAIPPLGTEAAEVWRRRQGAAVVPELDFDAAHREADRARGLARTVTHAVKGGDRVTVAGTLVRGTEGWSLAPAPDPTRPGEAPTVLVSADPPSAWYRRAIVLSVVGVLGFVGSAAAVTALALLGPAFGPLTTLAGVLGLGQFLGAQPLGVALRDAVTAPDRAIVHHDWADPRGAASRAAAPAA